MSKVIILLGLTVPVYVLCQGLLGLWRRFRLIRSPVSIEAKVMEVRASHVLRLEDATVVDVVARYEIDGRDYQMEATKTDHQRRQYYAGGPIELVYERGNPSNVIDAGRKPWDDVIGPVVFGLLLLAFMTWFLLFVTSLT